MKRILSTEGPQSIQQTYSTKLLKVLFNTLHVYVCQNTMVQIGIVRLSTVMSLNAVQVYIVT